MNMNVRIATMSLLWKNPVADEFRPWLARVRELGFEGVVGFAHRAWRRYLDHPVAFKKTLSDEGLDLAGLDVKACEDEALYPKVFEFLQHHGCPNLVCISADRKTVTVEQEAEWLSSIGEAASAYGVRCLVHNHTNGVAESFAETNQVLARSDPEHVFPLAETGHGTKDFTDIPDPSRRALEFVKTHGERIRHVEFKDWSPLTDLNTPLGAGMCDFPAVTRALEEVEYDGWIVFEQNGTRGLNERMTPDECARASREYMRDVLGV